EFVVGGYRPAKGSLDSILLGYYDGGELRYAGRVMAGITKHIGSILMQRFARRSVACPFDDLPHSMPSRSKHPWDRRLVAADLAVFRWIRPIVCVEVAFMGWDRHGLLRGGTLLGLRDDKPAHRVRREPVVHEERYPAYSLISFL